MHLLYNAYGALKLSGSNVFRGVRFYVISFKLSTPISDCIVQAKRLRINFTSKSKSYRAAPSRARHSQQTSRTSISSSAAREPARKPLPRACPLKRAAHLSELHK